MSLLKQISYDESKKIDYEQDIDLFNNLNLVEDGVVDDLGFRYYIFKLNKENHEKI